MSRLSFPELAEFVSRVTGGDGVDLILAINQEYGVDFERPEQAGRYLFHSEGVGLVGSVVRRLFGGSSVTVVPLTAGDLHLAVLRGRWEDPPWPAT